MSEEQQDNMQDMEPSSEGEAGQRLTEQESGLPPEVLENLPPEARREVIRAFSMMTGFTGPVVNPALNRITSEHINKIIDYTEADSRRESESESSIRKYAFAYFALELCALLALILFFGVREQWAVISSIITGILGFGGGFGLGISRGRH